MIALVQEAGTVGGTSNPSRGIDLKPCIGARIALTERPDADTKPPQSKLRLDAEVVNQPFHLKPQPTGNGRLVRPRCLHKLLGDFDLTVLIPHRDTHGLDALLTSGRPCASLCGEVDSPVPVHTHLDDVLQTSPVLGIQ